MSARFWADLTARDFPATEATVALLPLAAVEQHGPHLPLGTDTLIAEGMLARLSAACPEAFDLRILPVQAVGKSDEHAHVAGTLTLDAATALAAWTRIGLSVARAGVRRIVVVNSHGGNLPLLPVLAREWRIRAGMLAVTCQWMGFGLPEGVVSDREARFGIHGGDVETSLMLAFRPETVRMAEARDFRSAAEDWAIPPTGAIARGWVATDLNPEGVVGEAQLATAAKGEAIAAHQVAGMLALLAQVAATPLGGLKPLG